MAAVPFDTRKLADRLQAGGFTAQQAHTFASALAETAVSADLATKRDINDLEVAVKEDVKALETVINALDASVKRDLSLLESSVKRDLALLEASVKRDMIDVDQRLTIRMGGMFVVAVGVILAAIRYLPPH